MTDRDAHREYRRAEARSLVRIARDLLTEASGMTYEILTPEELKKLDELGTGCNEIWEKLARLRR